MYKKHIKKLNLFSYHKIILYILIGFILFFILDFGFFSSKYYDMLLILIGILIFFIQERIALIFTVKNNINVFCKKYLRHNTITNTYIRNGLATDEIIGYIGQDILIISQLLYDDLLIEKLKKVRLSYIISNEKIQHPESLNLESSKFEKNDIKLKIIDLIRIF